MLFERWPSLINHYRTKEIAWWVGQYPELAGAEYTITEKLHGSNLQFYVQPHHPVVVGSRNRFLDTESKFQKVLVSDILQEYSDSLSMLQSAADSTERTYRLFGELIGPGICKGVDYGTEYQMRLFGFMVDDDLASPVQTTQVLSMTHMRVVPQVGSTVFGLQRALEIDTEFDSKLSPADTEPGSNICEGVVIRPCNRVFTTEDGSCFIVKKKNDEFKEKSRAKKPPVDGDPEVASLHVEFVSYCTENRLDSLFSKLGEIERMDQIGDYIRAFLEDAKIDFLADFSDRFTKLDVKRQKRVLNVGRLVASMLKDRM